MKSYNGTMPRAYLSYRQCCCWSSPTAFISFTRVFQWRLYTCFLDCAHNFSLGISHFKTKAARMYWPIYRLDSMLGVESMLVEDVCISQINSRAATVHEEERNEDKITSSQMEFTCIQC